MTPAISHHFSRRYSSLLAAAPVVKLSRKSDYALRALLHLSGAGDRPIPVRELAEANGIPRKFLESIMRDLRARGLVESMAGKNGGYGLLRRPEDISVGSILRLFEVRLEPLPEDLPECDQEAPTGQVRRALQEIGDAVDSIMNELTLEDVIRQRPIRYSITNEAEFQFGDGI